MTTKPKKSDYLDFEISFLEKILKKKPDFLDALLVLAESYTRRGDFESGLKIDQRLAKLCPDDATVHYNLACSYALTGKKDLALKSLSCSIALGYDDFDHLKKDKDLDSLQGEKKFQALLAKGDKKKVKTD